MSEQTRNRNIILAVDVQNDFINGSLAVPAGENVVEPLNNLTEAARVAGDTVVFTRDWHPETTPHFDTWPVHCVQGTEGASFYPALDIDSGDIIISKGMGQTDGYSGVEGVSDDGITLEVLVAPKSPAEKVRVFIGGLATDYCVKATALDLAHHFADEPRVELFLIRDAVRAVKLQQDDERKALDAMEAAHIAALTSDEIMARFYTQEA